MISKKFGLWKFNLRPFSDTSTVTRGVTEICQVANIDDGLLIAAAPEMLEALELIAGDTRLMNDLSIQQIMAVTKAISKTRGKT